MYREELVAKMSDVLRERRSACSNVFTAQMYMKHCRERLHCGKIAPPLR